MIYARQTIFGWSKLRCLGSNCTYYKYHTYSGTSENSLCQTSYSGTEGARVPELKEKNQT
jgi:hypothetical protein